MVSRRTGALRRSAPVRAVLSGLCLLAGIASADAQTDRPREEELAALQERGRQIALYLGAVDGAENLMRAQGGAPADRIVAIPDREGWRVVYLGPSEGTPAPATASRKGPSIVAETTFSPDSGEFGNLRPLVPPKVAPSNIQSYVRCLEEGESATLSRPDGGRPLKEAIVRESDGTFSVYVISQRPEEAVPAPVAGRAESALLGRDFLVKFGVNGKQLLTTERLHESVATLSLFPRAPGAPLVHEHDKGDLPTPTDIALVLRYPVLAPLLVLTPRFMFRVDKAGTVTWLGANPNPKPASSAAPPGTGRP
ncbi:MAG TPA: hypothetical protein VKF61_10870 [Candidatus Polarisedimenticolia bacterium]|nr:hypothetical protein [Candidatus Polarisedimenticolia bacterium]